MPGLSGQLRPAIAGLNLPRPSSALAIGFACLLAGGLGLAIVLSSPILAIAIPGVAIGAVVCSVAPWAALAIAVVLASATGTLAAYVPAIPPKGLADYLILCLWAGTLWALAAHGRERRIVLWPGLLLPVFYVALTFGAVLVADSPSLGFESFRASAWYMLLLPLLALAPWDARVFRYAAYAIVAIALAAGTYSVFRYVVGPSLDETLAARTAQPSLLRSQEPRFFGAQLSAQDLVGWAAVLLPFSIAMLLVWRGRWRLVALATVGVLAFCLLAADVRTGVAAAAAGIAVTLLVFVLARAFPEAVRVGTGLIALAAVLTFGGVGYAVIVSDSPETAERFEALLDPGDDPNFQVRQERWSAAWDEIEKEPLGHGLGTTGAIARRGGDLPVGPPILDNSYLKVGIEQGLPVMVLFAFSMLLLMLGLAYRAATSTDPWRAALAMGAAGTVTAMIVLFYGSLYAELPAVVIPGWAIAGLGAAGFTSYPLAARSVRLTRPLQLPARSPAPGA